MSLSLFPVRRRAFTLIELLVVIAIIAILAAILFPVFAQAKLAAKKTQALSNVKNITTGVIIYEGDSDDLLPLSNIVMPDGAGDSARTSYNRFIPTPQSSGAPYTTAAGLDTLGAWYANAMRPYIKSEAIYDDPAATSTSSVYTLGITATTGSAVPVPTATLPNYGYAMNGLLNAYSSTSVAAPAGLIMISGLGMRKTPGCTTANPAMYCPKATQACVYTKGTATCGNGSTNGDSSFFTRASGSLGWDTYNRSWVVSYVDGHAKSRKLGVYSTGKTDPRNDPFATYNGTNGSVTSNLTRWYSAENAAGCHAYMFRPDLDFSTYDTAVAL